MSLNKVMLIGNLGSDPEIRYTQQGAAVANLRIATTEKWTNKDGSRQESTEWHRVVVFGKLAEICQQYLQKGRMVYIEGRLQTRTWQDQQGAKRYTTEIVAHQMQMLGARPDGGQKDRDRAAGEYGGGGDTSSGPMGGPGDDIPF